MDPRFFDWARRLQAAAQSGLAFTKNPFEIERYEEVRRIAAEMMAAAKEAEAKPVPPLDSIFGDVYAEIPAHLRAQSDFAVGHYSSRGEGVNEKGEFPL